MQNLLNLPSHRLKQEINDYKKHLKTQIELIHVPKKQLKGINEHHLNSRVYRFLSIEVQFLVEVHPSPLIKGQTSLSTQQRPAPRLAKITKSPELNFCLYDILYLLLPYPDFDQEHIHSRFAYNHPLDLSDLSHRQLFHPSGYSYFLLYPYTVRKHFHA